MYWYSTRQLYGDEKQLDPFYADERDGALASSEQAVMQTSVGDEDRRMAKALAAKHAVLRAMDAAVFAMIVAAARTNVETFVLQLRGAGWEWDAPPEACLEVATQLTDDAVLSQLAVGNGPTEIRPEQLTAVREHVLPPIVRAAAKRFHT